MNNTAAPTKAQANFPVGITCQVMQNRAGLWKDAIVMAHNTDGTVTVRYIFGENEPLYPRGCGPLRGAFIKPTPSRIRK
jgi:hypothetical protein